MSKKKYLVTGGLGFIGSELVNKLDGHITVLSRTDDKKNRLTNKDITLLIKDFSDLTKEDVKNVDCIYHLASTVHNYHILSDVNIDIDTNIKGTVHLLELCKDLIKKPRIIFPSTFFIYGNIYDKIGQPIDEDSMVDPLGLYPATKFCAENIIKLYSRLYNIPYNICRLTNVYGAGEDFSDPKKAWLNFFAMAAIKGEEANIYNGGDFQRDYIYVNDVVEALKFVESLDSNDTFLIGYGKPVWFKNMIDYILELTGNKIKVGVMDPPDFHKAVGIKNFVANTNKINSLGWKAKIDYKQGLKKIIDYYESL